MQAAFASLKCRPISIMSRATFLASAPFTARKRVRPGDHDGTRAGLPERTRRGASGLAAVSAHLPHGALARLETPRRATRRGAAAEFRISESVLREQCAQPMLLRIDDPAPARG
jgi:hypothetical protein